jgi:glycosyltransferase involved in cell wall biosynthesis
MKILYVVPFVPWPVRVRSFNLIPRLARNHEIHLVCVSRTEPTAEQVDWLAKYCKTLVHIRHNKWQGMAQCALALPTSTPLRLAYCRSQTARTAVKRVSKEVRPDVVYVERWRALEFLPEQLSAPLVCDPTDSMTLYNQRLIKAGVWWEKLIGWEEYRKFRRCEGELACRADVTVFCSRLDLNCVKEQAPDARCELIPNGVDCDKFYFKNGREGAPTTLIFTGSFKYRPNCHAAEYFLKEIFPLIRREMPASKFLAVGYGAKKALAGHRERDGIETIDFVQDLRPYLANATVAVAPLTIGAGVSNKVAEGFAVGTPVVATPLACGDLPVTSGEQLLIGRDPNQFADHVVRLLKDGEFRMQMALRARQFVEKHYDWEMVSGKMENLMKGLVLSDVREEKVRAFGAA